jgi:pyruvate dehydrogenase E2 component (dihydrolipoamide acetyltransferase)
VPSPMRGIVRELKIAAGDTVSQGSLVMSIERQSEAPIAAAPPSDAAAAASQAPIVEMREPSVRPVSAAPPFTAPAPQAPIVETHELSTAPVAAAPSLLPAYATPAVRRQARELGVDVATVPATGQKGRITRDDVLAYVNGVLRSPPIEPARLGAGASGLTVAPWPIVDFAKYGPIERQALSRIKTLSGGNLARNWVMIPHVTNFDEADVTDVEAFRQATNKGVEASGVKVTMLTFLIKAVVATLKQFKTFNASLDRDALVLKNYFHIGFAADTPRGLLVPVLRDADRKGVLDIAAETAALAKEARDGKLKPDAMQGGCFSISSLGGIGGTGFTPIINAPEVAILGVAKAATKPVWDGSEFRPRLIMPLSLSWDHRVVDGAEAGRFLVRLVANLGDIRRLLL